MGAGRVGLVAAACLANSGHEVICVEKDPARLEKLIQAEVPFYEEGLGELVESALRQRRLSFTGVLPGRLSDVGIVLVAAGTPLLPAGGVDLSYVYDAVNEVVQHAPQPLTLVMKSTVPPGTGVAIQRDLLGKGSVKHSYISNPEFLREGRAIHDWYHPDRIVIGGQDAEAIQRVREIYEGINAPVLVMDVTSAEVAKYAANAFLATKVSFINEIANLCELVGADIDAVARAVGMDHRIGTHYLKAGLGYGGSCLPKDTNGFAFVSALNGYDLRLLKTVIEVNAAQRRRAVDKLSQALGGLTGKRVAVLGLAFKPGTDDIRESPGIEIARLLATAGASVSACDPMAWTSACGLLPPEVELVTEAFSALQGCHAALLATEWEEFINLDWQKVRSVMRAPYVILDGRNALPRDLLRQYGFNYHGVGR